jgi:two-component system phosphate regulon response regulator PhoB
VSSRLLLLEDDASLGETLKERLELEGYQVVWAATVHDAKSKFNEQSYDLVLLDVGLPDGTGFEFAQFVNQTRPTPFLFMTAMNTAENRLEGYELGAEEFIPKPFHLKELFLRIGRVLKTQVARSETVVCGDRVIDLKSRSVISSDGQSEFLQSRDFDLLKLMIEAAPRVLSRDEILNSVWGEDKFPSHRTVDNAIVRLRQILGDDGGKIIRSVRGVGYQWVARH